MKPIYDIALEFVAPDGGTLTENQEAEVDALVQFGKRILEELHRERISPEECKMHGANAFMGFKFCPDCGNSLAVSSTFSQDGQLKLFEPGE